MKYQRADMAKFPVRLGEAEFGKNRRNADRFDRPIDTRGDHGRGIRRVSTFFTSLDALMNW